MIELEVLRRRLLAAFPGAEIALSDLTGGGDHWEARIVSAAFAGLGRVEQHRLVYAALAEELRGPIHALTLKTYTPEAWASVAGRGT